MARFFDWIKTHKFIAFLVLIILYFLFTKYSASPSPYSTPFSVAPESEIGLGMPTDRMKYAQTPSTGGFMPPPRGIEPPPAPDVKNRMVISESYLSLLVSNVVDAQKRILTTVENYGGYMVNTYLQNPQDAPTSTITLRIPATKLQAALEEFRKISVKVVTENLQGEDVTDAFVDNEARLATLMKTKTKFEEILDKAVNVQDILTVQRELINLQNEIDAVRGQQKFLEKSAEMAKITIYLSTDELALPYAPSETWRPEVIFKQAVRSLIGLTRTIGERLIWIAVYSVIWIPILLVVTYLWKRTKKT